MLGRCPVCGEWGTYEEDVAVAPSKGGVALRRGTKAQLLHEVEAKEEMRLDMHSSELNRVLGFPLHVDIYQRRHRRYSMGHYRR